MKYTIGPFQDASVGPKKWTNQNASNNTFGTRFGPRGEDALMEKRGYFFRGNEPHLRNVISKVRGDVLFLFSFRIYRIRSTVFSE